MVSSPGQGLRTLDAAHSQTYPSDKSRLSRTGPEGGLFEITHLQLQALYDIARLVGSALDLEKALGNILRVLHDRLKMDRATLVLLHENGDYLTIKASYGLTPQEQKRGVYSLSEGVCGKIFQTCSPFVVPDIHNEPLFLNKTRARNAIDKGTISFIGVPVVLREKPVGVLTVDRLFGPEISFEEDVRFLTVVAALIAQFLNLHQAISESRRLLVEENQLLKARLQVHSGRHDIIGTSKAIKDVLWAVDKVASTNATVLLLGESGTGKELVARAIHVSSPRQANPFIKVNCAALPEALLESELLGHERGAFTGALNAKKGRFELAHKGTLFLDEIGELPLALQAKLLRVLQEQQFERLGGTETIKVDVRVIAATNRKLEEAVAQGSFRSDLFYRLNVVPIMLPPLRERREDIPLLIDHFLKISNKRHKRNIRLSRLVLDFLMEYQWPGNVRELQNLVERLVIMADGNVVGMQDLPSHMFTQAHEGQDGCQAYTVQNIPVAAIRPRSLREIEKEQIEAALRRHGWVQSKAAKELGLTQRQIGYRIKKYGIVLPGKSAGK